MPLIFSADDLDVQARLRDAFDPIGPGQPRQGAAAGQPLRRAAARPGGRVGVSREASLDVATRRGLPSCVRGASRRRRSCRSAGARSGRSAARRPDGAPRSRAPAGIVDVRPRRADGHRRRGHDRRRRSTRVLGRGGPGVPARSAGSRRPPSAACSRSGCPGHRRLRYGPLRDRAARGALRHRRRSPRQGRRHDGQERQRLRPPPAARRLARHARRDRPGDAAVPSRAPADVGLVRDRRRPGARCAAARFRPSTHPRRTAARTHVLLEGHADDVAAEAATATGVADRPDRRRGRRVRTGAASRCRPSAVDARRRRARRTTGCAGSAEAGVGTVHVAADDAGGLAAAREVAAAPRRLAAPRGGRARPRRVRRRAAERRASWRGSRTRFDPTGKLQPGRLPLP